MVQAEHSRLQRELEDVGCVVCTSVWPCPMCGMLSGVAAGVMKLHCQTYTLSGLAAHPHALPALVW